MGSPVIIVDYDPVWPALFEAERRRVLEVVGDKVLAIEHVGSTAVPGLGAKPIIDMLAGVEGADDADKCVPLLAEIGYTDVTPEIGNPEWFYCLGKGPHSVGYYLHLVKYPSDHWERHVIFRDHLRGPSRGRARIRRAETGAREEIRLRPPELHGGKDIFHTIYHFSGSYSRKRTAE